MSWTTDARDTISVPPYYSLKTVDRESLRRVGTVPPLLHTKARVKDDIVGRPMIRRPPECNLYLPFASVLETYAPHTNEMYEVYKVPVVDHGNTRLAFLLRKDM